MGLAVAAGGGAVAGSLITSANIKDGTIRSVDIRDGSIKLRDLRPSVRAQLVRLELRPTLGVPQTWEPGASGSASVLCEGGGVAVGGGYEVTGDSAGVRVLASRPAGLGAAFVTNEWVIQGVNDGAAAAVVTPWVTCAG